MNPLPIIRKNSSLYERVASCVRQLGPFEPHPRVAIAVSGGPDSLALCLLLHRFFQNQGGQTIAVSVDHGLRHDETNALKKLTPRLKKEGIAHIILPLELPEFAHQRRIEETARLYRHQALESFCSQEGILHLFLGHQQDEQKETQYMRRCRQTTPFGEEGMDKVSPRFFGRLLRPLLDIPKADLLTFLEEGGWDWFEDSMNQDKSFERSRIRQNMLALPLQKREIRKEYRQTFCHEVGKGAIRFSPLGAAYMDINQQPETLEEKRPSLFWAFRHLINVIGGQIYPPSPSSLKTLLAQSKEIPRFSLGGCVIERKQVAQGKNIFLFARDTRAPLPEVQLSILHKSPLMLFDRRFRLCHTENWQQELSSLFGSTNLLIRLMGETDLQRVKQSSALWRPFLKTIPPLIQRSLPALYDEQGNFLDIPLWRTERKISFFLCFSPLQNLFGPLTLS